MPERRSASCGQRTGRLCRKQPLAVPVDVPPGFACPCLCPESDRRLPAPEAVRTPAATRRFLLRSPLVLLFGNLRSLLPGRGFDGCILGARLILLGIAFDLPQLALALDLAVAQQIADRFFDLAADVFG